jgi:hypothetical protein
METLAENQNKAPMNVLHRPNASGKGHKLNLANCTANFEMHYLFWSLSRAGWSIHGAESLLLHARAGSKHQQAGSGPVEVKSLVSCGLNSGLYLLVSDSECTRTCIGLLPAYLGSAHRGFITKPSTWVSRCLKTTNKRDLELYWVDLLDCWAETSFCIPVPTLISMQDMFPTKPSIWVSNNQKALQKS